MQVEALLLWAGRSYSHRTVEVKVSGSGELVMPEELKEKSTGGPGPGELTFEYIGMLHGRAFYEQRR